MPKKPRARAIKEIKDVVARTDPEVAAEILMDAALKVSAEIKSTPLERQPGRVVHGLKTPWTHQDLVKAYGVMTFTPDDTMPITISGVIYQLIAGREMHVPKKVYDRYREVKQQQRDSINSFPKDRGFDTFVLPGAGALD